MLDIKKIVIAFLLGFFLSLLFGLIGQVSAGVMFLRAFIFGLVFVALTWGAIFVFDKFLQVDGSVEVESSIQENEQLEKSHAVDILVDDDLPDMKTAPTFEIIKNGSTASASSFVPASLDTVSSNTVSVNEENSESVSETVPSGENEVEPTPSVVSTSSGDLSELDELEQLLPSVESFSDDNDEETDDIEDDVIFDTDTPSLGVTMSVGENHSTSVIDGNVKDMAAAISTILVNDP